MSIYLRRSELTQCTPHLPENQREAFTGVLNTFKFSSDNPTAVAYEGEFQRALGAAGLGEDFQQRLTLIYRRIVEKSLE